MQKPSIIHARKMEKINQKIADEIERTERELEDFTWPPENILPIKNKENRA